MTLLQRPASIRRPTRAPACRGGQPVLAIRACTSDVNTAQFIRDALEELHGFLLDHDLQPAGRPFTLVKRTRAPGTRDIEVGWPVDRPFAGTGRIHSGTLPAALTGRSGLPLPDTSEQWCQ
jgi:hypothetical protein